MATDESGFLGASLSRTRSLIHSHTASAKSHSLQIFSHKNAECRPNCRSSLSTDQAAMKSPFASRKEMKRKKDPSKSRFSKKGTILRAVPETTTTISPLDRDMATLANQEVLASIATYSPPASDGQPSFRSPIQVSSKQSHKRSPSSSTLSITQAGTEMHFPELKGAIGVYKHGKIAWDEPEKSPRAGTRASITPERSPRPQIQVVIPNDQRYRPLPTSPFFGQAPFSHNNAGPDHFAHDVSPPSVTRGTIMRDSVVSPLGMQQQQHSVPQFHALVVPQEDKAESEYESLNKGNIVALSNSSYDSHEDDAGSVYSKTSSKSSFDGTSPPKPPRMRINFLERTASATFSIKSPVLAGVFDADTTGPERSEGACATGETGPRCSPETRCYAPHPPIAEDVEFAYTCGLRPLRSSNNGESHPMINHRPSKRASQRRITSDQCPEMGSINQAIICSSSAQLARDLPSPTLSEAENELEQQLTAPIEEYPFEWDTVVPHKRKSYHRSAIPPPLPRKSSKRHSPFAKPDFRLSRVPGNHIASQMKRNRSLGKVKGLKIDIPKKAKRMTDDFFLSPISIPPRNMKRAITPDVAENVILAIFRNLETFDDLFSTALISQGFHRVYKRHELDLMKSTLRKMSPPAWEHREICYPGHDQVVDLETSRMEYAPTTYFQHHTRDVYIIEAIKSMVKKKCQSFLRPEIAIALMSGEPVPSARVDDALWRIWTFCKIFGSGKGREEDIVAQMDWLKGGLLVHQTTCTFSVLTTDSIDMNHALASAPECFGEGNEGGLTAEQLFDMMELWNCLGVLLQPFEGRTVQAREYGIYDNTHVRGGDIDGEEAMLDEWYYYLMTLGLSPIFDLAAPCHRSDPSAFMLASQNGWVHWDPPMFGGTRRNFLKEAASRVYEDKITITYAESSTREVQRQLSKQRIQNHITELRRRKNNNTERLAPVRISQADERPMSEWEDVLNKLSRIQPPTASNLVSHIPSLRPSVSHSSISQHLPAPISELPASRTPPPPSNMRPRSPPRRTVAQPLLPSPPPSTVPSISGDHRNSIAPSMPSIDEHPAFRHYPESIPEMPALDTHPTYAHHLRNRSVPNSDGSNEDHPAFHQHQQQSSIFESGAAENTADKAVFRIVEMGFTAEQAKGALRMTDLGDGLRVESAVELLLREM